MNRRQMIRSLALTTLGVCACLALPTRATAGTGSVAIRILKPMGVGETVNYDSQLKITFSSVIDDSRCPQNKTCKDPGDAEVVLRIKVGTKKVKNYYLHTQTYPKQLKIAADPAAKGSSVKPKYYLVDIATLNPQPYPKKPTKQSDYQLQLHVAEEL